MNVKKTFSHGLVMAAVAITGAFGLMACSDNDDNTVVEPEYPPVGNKEHKTNDGNGTLGGFSNDGGNAWNGSGTGGSSVGGWTDNGGGAW